MWIVQGRHFISSPGVNGRSASCGHSDNQTNILRHLDDTYIDNWTIETLQLDDVCGMIVVMSDATLYPRFLRPRIVEALADSPVVLIHGPRQCGKTTLARLVGDEAGYTYFSFDDDVQR